ncbi:MAG: RDD family protein [Candidatus Lambdaproteobacteria bacterium]|nr:RDD family protein [Candidatus Lambdaproteobacteria bacterium]
METTPRTAYAGFWRRVVAAFIDSAVAVAAGNVLGFAVGILAAGTGGNPQSRGWLLGILLASLAFGWLYFALLECSRIQATLGKRAMGIQVTDLGGGRISFEHATGRYFGKYVSLAILGIGFLMVAFTAKKQGLHDILARTLVVKAAA